MDKMDVVIEPTVNWYVEQDEVTNIFYYVTDTDETGN